MSESKYIVAYPPVDFSRPFTDLSPSEVDIYFHYTNEIGRKTCKASCGHCYFRNQAPFSIPAEKALAITISLRGQGYNIGMAPADSFSDDALAAGNAGSAYRLRAMGNLAWTSGMPLYLPGWEQRLDRAWDMGFTSIVANAHDAAGTLVPFPGVTRRKVIQAAMDNIRAWNDRNAPRRFSRAVTFTIRNDNCDIEQMRRMVAWGVEEELDLVRFNAFSNFQGVPEFRQYELTHDDIVRFYANLAALQEEFMAAPTSLGISEDWGDAGIEQIYPYLPSEWQKRVTGWCRTGYRLFAMIEVRGEIVLVGCVDKWEPILGRLRKLGPDDYRVEWDQDRIETIRQAVLQQKVYACWGGVGCNRPMRAGFSMTDPIVEGAIFKK